LKKGELSISFDKFKNIGFMNLNLWLHYAQ
jgi:hypothetical protein